MERDPFLSMTKLCRPTASQEVKFPNCPFARESENFPNLNSESFSSSPDPTPSEPAGIVVVTPPNLAELSPDGGSKKARACEAGAGCEFDSERTRVPGGELGGGSEAVPAVETELILEGNEGAHDEEMADLDFVVRKACERSKGEECESTEDVNVSEGKMPSVKSKKITIKIKCNGVIFNVGGSEKVCRDEKRRIEELRYVDSQRRRKDKGDADGGCIKELQLLGSLEGKGKNAVELGRGLLDSLNLLKFLVGEMGAGCEDDDFLGTAKRQGLTFPRPRWW